MRTAIAQLTRTARGQQALLVLFGTLCFWAYCLPPAVVGFTTFALAVSVGCCLFCGGIVYDGLLLRAARAATPLAVRWRWAGLMFNVAGAIGCVPACWSFCRLVQLHASEAVAQHLVWVGNWWFSLAMIFFTVGCGALVSPHSSFRIGCGALVSPHTPFRMTGQFCG